MGGVNSSREHGEQGRNTVCHSISCGQGVQSAPLAWWIKRIPHWSRFADRTCDSVGDLHWSTEGLHPIEETLVAAVHEELQPMGRIQTEAINGRLFLWEGLWAEAWESPPPEWEVAETMCDDPIVNPIPIPGHHWGEVGRESEINLRWEAERSGRKVLLRFGFTSHYLTLIWLATNSRNFPKCFALENTFECLFLSLSHPMRVSLYWLSPVQLMRTVERLYHASGTQPTSQHRQKCYLSNLKNSTHCGSFQYTNFHIQPPSAVFRFIARSLNF